MATVVVALIRFRLRPTLPSSFPRQRPLAACLQAGCRPKSLAQQVLRSTGSRVDPVQTMTTAGFSRSWLPTAEWLSWRRRIPSSPAVTSNNSTHTAAGSAGDLSNSSPRILRKRAVVWTGVPTCPCPRRWRRASSPPRATHGTRTTVPGTPVLGSCPAVIRSRRVRAAGRWRRTPPSTPMMMRRCHRSSFRHPLLRPHPSRSSSSSSSSRKIPDRLRDRRPPPCPQGSRGPPTTSPTNHSSRCCRVADCHRSSSWDT